MNGTVLRLYDPARDPSHWDAIIKPGQLAVFGIDTATGQPCQLDGRPFASPAEASCVVFDSLDEARARCEAEAARTPTLFFEIFDHSGRAKPALATVGRHPESNSVFSNPRFAPWRRAAAVLMLPMALGLFWVDYQQQGLLVFPTAIGLNLLVFGIRLLLLDAGVTEAGRRAKQRLAEHERRASGD